MERVELAKRIKAVSYRTGQFRLRSGKISSFYWDKYGFESQPDLLGAVVEHLAPLLPRTFDRLAGLELGGIPLVTGLSLATGRPCLFVRKTPKHYGTCNLVEGAFERGDTAVIVEDVVTTGGQVCRSVRQMRELGLKVKRVLCVIDRGEGARASLQEITCSLASLFTLEELTRLTGEYLL